MNYYVNLSLKSILSGILISIGAYAYLKVGGIAGAVLFAFGIITIVKLGIGLFTGVAGTNAHWKDKLTILCLNVFGAIIGGVALMYISNGSLETTVCNLVDGKLNSHPFITFTKGIFCGVIVDTAVYISKRDNSVIALLIGIPVFILSGFYHSIADSAYYGMYLLNHIGNIESAIYLLYLLCVIIGNYFGCNLRKLLIK